MIFNFLRNETAWLNHIITQNAGLTDKQFFEREIIEWKNSQRRKHMILGERYYQGIHDILTRKREAIGADGALTEVINLPNNHIVDNQYAKMVDQKVNYLLGQPLTFDSESDEYVKALKDIFSKRFQRTLRNLGEDSLNGGIGWLHPHYDEDGNFSIKRFEPYEILPFWADSEHTKLDCAVRLYEMEVYKGPTKEIIEKVEIYTKEGVYRFTLDGNALVPDDEPHSHYFTVTNGMGKPVPYNWDRVPLVAFKYNSEELPLIRRVKSLQDGINAMLSDFENNMQEDSRNTILVIKNYDGENLGEFRRNLATYGAVKVRADGDSKGGVDTLTVQVSADNYKAILDLLKKALIENARGYDAKDDRLTTGQANQMNIQSMYSDIDLDANGMETEYQASFEDLLWFVNKHLANTGAGSFEQVDVTLIFNRDMLVNESEVIKGCKDSMRILSLETIISQHPWTSDVEKELKRLEKEKQADIDAVYGNAFQPQTGGEVIAEQ